MGEYIEVYEEISQMGPAAFEKQHLTDVQAVVTETMTRVSYNLQVIQAALTQRNYGFHRNPRHDFQYPLLKPGWQTNFRIRKLKQSVSAYGHMPLSLITFFQVVGSCNFAWDYEADPKIPWEEADPIQIAPISDILTSIKDDLEVQESDDGPIGIQVSADYYHKDNISGGPPYAVELTPALQVDSQFLNEAHNTSFVDYLRITLNNCGFSRTPAINDLTEFIGYCEKVRPMLKPI